MRFSESYARVLLHKLGYGFRKLQPIPGKADPERQEE
ncbi:MAG: winged helix-turn-helix domain-containing protein [Muribaculaceae bacterium]